MVGNLTVADRLWNGQPDIKSSWFYHIHLDANTVWKRYEPQIPSNHA